MKRLLTVIKKVISAIVLVAVVLSCEEDNPPLLGKKQIEFPSRTMINVDMVMKETGNLVLRVKAPLMEDYEFTLSEWTPSEEEIK